MNWIAPAIFFSGILAIIFMYLYSIIDIHRNKELRLSQRRNWLNLVWFLPLLGSLLYLFRGSNFVTRLFGPAFNNKVSRE